MPNKNIWFILSILSFLFVVHQLIHLFQREMDLQETIDGDYCIKCVEFYNCLEQLSIHEQQRMDPNEKLGTLTSYNESGNIYKVLFPASAKYLIAERGHQCSKDGYWIRDQKGCMRSFAPQRFEELKDFMAWRGLTKLYMQQNGNLVLYKRFNTSTNVWTNLWSTNTAGYTNAYVALQYDANLALYPSGGGGAIWAINVGGGEAYQPYKLYVNSAPGTGYAYIVNAVGTVTWQSPNYGGTITIPSPTGLVFCVDVSDCFCINIVYSVSNTRADSSANIKSNK